VYDADGDHAAAVADEFGGRAFASLGELLESADAVTVAVPTKYHLAVAKECFAAHGGRGVHVLIEKPLAATVQECREIAERASRTTGGRGGGPVTVQVGHVERFNPAVRAMSRLGVRPRFIEVTRVSPLTFRSIDVGVVLDMMIHDIDIVLLLAGASESASGKEGVRATSVEAVGVSVIGTVEDVCNARVKFATASGEEVCVANLTASRLAMKTERKLRVFSPDAYVSLDYQKKYGIVARRGENLGAIRDAVAKIRAGEIEDLSQLNYTDLVQVEELQIDDVEPLRAELESFLGAIRTSSRPVVSVEDGLAAVELATRIVEAIGGASL
jgi:predicted dehydrogenase